MNYNSGVKRGFGSGEGRGCEMNFSPFAPQRREKKGGGRNREEEEEGSVSLYGFELSQLFLLSPPPLSPQKNSKKRKIEFESPSTPSSPFVERC